MTTESLGIELLARKAAEDIREAKADTIRAILDRLVGEGQYNGTDILDHGHIEVDDQGTETFYFDGRAIVKFYAPEVIWGQNKDSVSYHIDLPHEVLVVEGEKNGEPDQLH